MSYLPTKEAAVISVFQVYGDEECVSQLLGRLTQSQEKIYIPKFWRVWLCWTEYDEKVSYSVEI